MTGRRMFVLLAVMLMVFPASGVFAQAGPTLYCGTLPEADCEFLMQSQEAMTKVHSAAFAFEFDMAFAGMEDVFEVDPLELGVSADGQFMIDPELAAELMTANEPEAMAAMMAKMPDALVEVLRSFAGDLSLNLDLPKVLLAEMGDFPVEQLDLVMVEGVFYVDISPFTESETEGPAWLGIDVASLVETMYGEMMTDSDIAGMLDMQIEMNSEMVSQVMEMESLNKFVDITRGADAEVDGVPVAVFTTTIDYAGMFSDEAFLEWLSGFMAQMLEAQGESMEDLPENFGEVMGAMLSGLDLEIVEQIGLEDYFTRHLGVDMAFSLDPAAIAAMAGEDMGDVPENFNMSMSMTVDLSNINGSVEIVAPEGAQVIDPMMFLGPEMGADTK